MKLKLLADLTVLMQSKIEARESGVVIPPERFTTRSGLGYILNGHAVWLQYAAAGVNTLLSVREFPFPLDHTLVDDTVLRLQFRYPNRDILRERTGVLYKARNSFPLPDPQVTEGADVESLLFQLSTVYTFNEARSMVLWNLMEPHCAAQEKKPSVLINFSLLDYVRAEDLQDMIDAVEAFT